MRSLERGVERGEQRVSLVVRVVVINFTVFGAKGPLNISPLDLYSNGEEQKVDRGAIRTLNLFGRVS
jgi:hypothetical protein